MAVADRPVVKLSLPKVELSALSALFKDPTAVEFVPEAVLSRPTEDEPLLELIVRVLVVMVAVLNRTLFVER
jgi:hypothetical protein